MHPTKLLLLVTQIRITHARFAQGERTCSVLPCVKHGSKPDQNRLRFIAMCTPMLAA